MPTTAGPTNTITTSAEQLAERLVLGALIDGVTAGVSAVVVDSGKVEIVIAAVVSDRGFLFPNRDVFTEYEGTITHADGSADGWELRVLFPDK